ncbi:hypothetical protein Tco_1197382, partial [Tanacetum coccineum]
MIERNFVKIQGAFLVKIRDNNFNGTIGENAFKHINKFLEVVGPIKINGENLVEKFVQKFYQLSNDNEEIEAEEDDNPDDITDIFKIKGNLFDYETPLTYEEYELNNTVTRDLEEPWSDNGVPYQLCDHICEPYRFNNGITKYPTCSSDIDGFCNGGELLGMVRVESMTYFQDHKWDDELADGKLKQETLMYKAKVEESRGNATP